MKPGAPVRRRDGSGREGREQEAGGRRQEQEQEAGGRKCWCEAMASCELRSEI